MPRIRSKKKEKLSLEVYKLSTELIHTESVQSMTDAMHTVYCWGLANVPIHKLRAWKKEFKKDIKDYEEMLARPVDNFI